MSSFWPRIVVVGSVNVDLTFRVPRLPTAGETVAGLAFTIGHGGKGANQAVMAARLGTAVHLVGCVGTDPFADAALANLREQGIDTTYVRRVDGPTGTAAILVDDAARNCIAVVAGANAALTTDDVHAAADAIQSAVAVLAQNETPSAASLAAFRLARAVGVTTIYNPAPAPDASTAGDLLRWADLCVPNESELAALTGLTDPEAGARRLLERGPRAVLVTLGDRGVLVVDADGTELIAGLPVAAADTSGAGDAFIGAFAAFLGEGLSRRDAARRANAAAALSVTRPGTQASFPDRSEVSRLGIG